METNIELYDIQRTRQCEDTLTTSGPYIRGRLQLPRWNSMERSNTTRTTTGEINQGQYGGCPGRDYTSVMYLEELRRDISILTRVSYANFDNDADSCFINFFCSNFNVFSFSFSSIITKSLIFSWKVYHLCQNCKR